MHATFYAVYLGVYAMLAEAAFKNPATSAFPFLGAFVLTVLLVCLYRQGCLTIFRTEALDSLRAGALRRGESATLEGTTLLNAEVGEYEPTGWMRVTVKNPEGVTRGDGTHVAFGAPGLLRRGATVKAIGFPSMRDVLCAYETRREPAAAEELPSGTWFTQDRLLFVTSTKRYNESEQARRRAAALRQQEAEETRRAEHAEKAHIRQCAA